MNDFVVEPGGNMQGCIRVPGDKSISHRSIMFGAIADGDTSVSGLLEGEDVLATLAAFRAMGVQIEGPDNGNLLIHGAGMHGLQKPGQDLDMGNSGTAMRLLSGLLAAQSFDTTLVGDTSLNKRPMSRVIDPLGQMGASIDAAEGGRPPLHIRGGGKLHGIHCRMSVASAQVKSALLLAGLYAEGRTTVTEPAPTRDHTERMLRGFGYEVPQEGATISVNGGGCLQACTIEVPADISSAAFFIVGALISPGISPGTSPGSELLLPHVGINPTRIGIITILKQMGAQIHLEKTREVGGEPVADIRVQHSVLKGIPVPGDQVPLAIDEFPVLCIAAACAQGQTVIQGAEELRVKESDRITAMVAGLKTLGIAVEEKPDGMIIEGGSLGGGEVDSFDDHRVAMAFTIAGLRASKPIHVRNCRNVATSFPDFVNLATQAGLSLKVEAA
ncbi:MAG: hypothetical protein BMS9Abin11_1165 [Gammaproteobacteria bacterium]|nr:MAG: hypothetical protein BMS9Abin11_1165 [Gammaproteobacteria bacterium]